MSKPLTIVDDDTARRIYKSGAPELKEILENSYGKAFFSQDITEIITSFEAACEYNNTSRYAKRFTVGTRNQIYQERVAEIVKALNQGWVANYDDPNEDKFGPVFYLRKDSSNPTGFRFYVSFFGHSGSLTSGGSRFALRTRALSDFMGKHFTKEYEYWYMPDPNAPEEKNVNATSSRTVSFTGTMDEWEKYIMGRVNSFEDACREKGIDPESYQFNTGTPDEISYKKGKLWCDVLNGPFMHLMKDRVSPKWYAWMEKTDTGFRFGGSVYDDSGSSATGGSRLRLCSEKLAKDFATKAAETMAPYWWNE